MADFDLDDIVTLFYSFAVATDVLELTRQFLWDYCSTNHDSLLLYRNNIASNNRALYPLTMSYLGLSEHIDFDSLPDPSGRIRLDEVIGEGTYGEVFRAFDLETGMSGANLILCYNGVWFIRN